MTSPGQVDMGSAATLVVVWRSGQSAHGRMVKAGGPVVSELRSYAEQALAALGGESRPYNPDDELEAGEFFSAGRDELFDTGLLELVEGGASLPLISPDELRQHPLALYALVAGDDLASQVTFIRKTNPVKLASKGLITRLFDESLTRVTEPILVFDPAFDVILYGDRVWILNQNNFEALFKESEAVLAQTTAWVDKLHENLPITADSKAWLARRLRENAVTRRKVQSILNSRYFSDLRSLDPARLRDRMTAHELDPGKLMEDGNLVFSKDTERDVLLFLNEDLWQGDFSGDQYAAARKRARGQKTQ